MREAMRRGKQGVGTGQLFRGNARLGSLPLNGGLKIGPRDSRSLPRVLAFPCRSRRWIEQLPEH